MAIHYLECAARTKLPAAKKLVLMAIADDADKQTRVGACGLQDIRDWSGLGRSQALAVIAELVTDGYLIRRAAGRAGRKAEFVVFPGGCCELHGAVPGHVPAGSGSPDPVPQSPSVDTAVDSTVEDLGTASPAGSGEPDPAQVQGPMEGPEEGPAQTGPLPYPPIQEPPNPPPSGGRTGRCSTTTRPHSNCRGCGTTVRQLADADRRRRAAVRHRCDIHGPVGWTDSGTCRGCAADAKAAS